MERMLKNKRTILFFILPALLLYLFFEFIPIASTIYYSFFKWNLIGDKIFVGLENYIKLFTLDDIFNQALKNTFLVLLFSLLIEVPAGLLLAVALTKKIKFKGFFKTVFFLPNMISSVAIGLMWSNIYNVDFGLVNSFLRFIGLGKATHVWLGENGTVMGAIIVVICWQYIGYHMVLYFSGLQGIPDTIFEAATIDGAAGWNMLKNITLPLLKPIIKIDAVLIATGSLRSFDLVFTMTKGGPDHASELLATQMYEFAFKRLQYGYGSALSIVMLLLSVVVTVFINRALKGESFEY